MFYLAVNKVKKNMELDDIEKIVPDHVAWVANKISEGIVVQAGKWGNTGGILIINAESLKEAKDVLGSDPLISSGLFDFELDEFYPSVEL